VSYRGKVKNGGNNRKARDNVEHIFSDGFEPPRWRLIRASEQSNSTFIGRRQLRNLITTVPRRKWEKAARRIAASIASCRS
jgi:hypothetical protein